jgi:hypothetical protein
MFSYRLIFLKSLRMVSQLNPNSLIVSVCAAVNLEKYVFSCEQLALC